MPGLGDIGREARPECLAAFLPLSEEGLAFARLADFPFACPGAKRPEPKLVFAAAPTAPAAFCPTCAPPPPSFDAANLPQESEQRMKQAWVGWRWPSSMKRSFVLIIFASRGRWSSQKALGLRAGGHATG